MEKAIDGRLTGNEVARIRDACVDVPGSFEAGFFLSFPLRFKMSDLGFGQQEFGRKRGAAGLANPMDTAVQRRFTIRAFETHGASGIG